MNHKQPTTYRIVSIDALRGFALFGILVVNIFVFHAPYAHYGPFYMQFPEEEMMILQLMIALFAGKFMFLFAFLFGYGCWLQYQKYENYFAFRSFWTRRMLILAGFGLLHVLLFSFGDILLPYALLGLLLPLCIRWKNWQIALLAVLVYAIPVYEFVARQQLGYEPIFMQSDYSLEDYIHIYTQGSIGDRFQLRMHDYWSFRNEKLIMYIPKELGLFLAGILAGRAKLAEQLNTKKALIFVGIALAIMISWYSFSSSFKVYLGEDMNILSSALFGSLTIFVEIIHGFLYIIGFWLLWKWNIFRLLIQPLQYVGKLSLTNYILQSAICMSIFSGFGLGLYASLPPSQLIILAVGIFSVQCVYSWWWLQRYTFGPLEWVWRKLAYGQIKPQH